MSDPKCGLLGNVWLDSTTPSGVVYGSDDPTKKAVGTVTVSVSGAEVYKYRGIWQEGFVYNSTDVVVFKGHTFECKAPSLESPVVEQDGEISYSDDWRIYTPPFVSVYVESSDFQGQFNKQNASKFMSVFNSLVFPWDGTVMIPGLVVSSENKLFATTQIVTGLNELVQSVNVGFNGVEDYL